MHTDPIADLLTRIRNASRAHRRTVSVSTSKFKLAVLEALKAEGFIGGFEVKPNADGPDNIDIALRYDAAGEPVITGIRRISKPGLRRYSASDKVAKVRSGLGVTLLTTSKGVMTDREARKQNVGGEIIATVW